MEPPTLEARRELGRSSGLLTWVALGVIAAFLGPCIRAERGETPPGFARMHEEVLLDALVLIPRLVPAAGAALVGVACVLLSRRDLGDKVRKGMRASGALALLIACLLAISALDASNVLDVPRPAGAGYLLAGSVLAVLFSRSMRSATERAELVTAARHWKVAGNLTLAAGAGMLLLLAVLTTGAGARPPAEGLAKVLLACAALVVFLLPPAALIAFFMAMSATYKTLRLHRRAAGARARS